METPMCPPPPPPFPGPIEAGISHHDSSLLVMLLVFALSVSQWQCCTDMGPLLLRQALKCLLKQCFNQNLFSGPIVLELLMHNVFTKWKPSIFLCYSAWKVSTYNVHYA